MIWTVVHWLLSDHFLVLHLTCGVIFHSCHSCLLGPELLSQRSFITDFRGQDLGFNSFEAVVLGSHGKFFGSRGELQG